MQAPAGFGKTTALADVARGAREQGLVAGWISLDGDETPNLFGSYLVAAFENAGLDLALLDAHDAWSSWPAVQQMGMLARAIELHAAPCLLVLDEVDRLPRRTVRLLDLLVKRAPDNLHVAMTCRSDPGIELAMQVLNGEAIIVGPHHLRFSKADIAEFFEGGLSRRELAGVEEDTAGWPVALMVHRNLPASESAGRNADAARLTENYIGVCVLRDLSADDRACLLDVAVFDWIEADLVDDVLGSSDARTRVAALRALDGLLLPIGGDRTVRRLHPLLRDYCLDVLSVEDPSRKRSLHRRIALALARQGQLTPAWRHARETGDSRLVGELIERFGVFQLWLREGVTRLISAGRFLTPEIIALYPRLELLQCVILRLSSRFDEANALFEAVARKTDGFTRDRDGEDADALAVDRVFTEGVLVGGADRLPPDELDSRLPAGGTTADHDEHLVASARHTFFLLRVPRARPLRREPPARCAGPGALCRGRAVRRCLRERLPGDVGHGAGPGRGGHGVVQSSTAGRQEVLFVRSLPHGEYRRAGHRVGSGAKLRESDPEADAAEHDGGAGGLGRGLCGGDCGERRVDVRAV